MTTIHPVNQPTTVRVIDIAARKNLVEGVTLSAAEDMIRFIQREKPTLKLEIRREYA